METTNYNILRIYASSTDQIEHKLLYEYIVHLAKEDGISGVTVYRGIMGYGESSKHINSSRYWELTEKLPVVIEIIDRTDKLESFYSKLETDLINMSKGCLVTIEPIKVMLLKQGERKER